MTVARRGRTEKPRRGAPQAAGISETAWHAIEDVLLPGARPEIARLVREVRDYVEAERVDRAALPGSRKRRRTAAARVEGAVTILFNALRILRSSREAAAVGLELEPDTARAFQIDAGRFETQWTPYLTRLQGRTGWLARHRERPSPGHNYVREVVVARLSRIVKTYRRDPTGPLLTQERGEEPTGVLVEVAAALRDVLPCLPRGDAALYRALERARTAATQRQVIRRGT